MKGIEFNAYDLNMKTNDSGLLSGYAVVWDVIDQKGDIHRKGAYKKTISENGDLPLLPNHDQNNPIGRVFNLIEDDYGLKFEANFASTDRAQEYRKLIQEEVIKKFSMGWSALRMKRMPNGGREILEVKLFEVSPVAVPVGESTMVLEVNNITMEEVPSTLDRFYGLAKNIGDKKLKLANQAELLKLAEEYKIVTQPEDSTEPIEINTDAVNDEYLTELNEVLKLKLKI